MMKQHNEVDTCIIQVEESSLLDYWIQSQMIFLMVDTKLFGVTIDNGARLLNESWMAARWNNEVLIYLQNLG